MAQESIDPDEAFALLSNRRRRHLLYLLARRDEARSVRVVARELIGRLEGTDPTEIGDGTYRSVYVSLYQRHVPRLAAAGIVDYDETERRVRLVRGRRTETLLRLVGIDPNGPRAVGRRTWTLLIGVAVGATLCGLLALVDRSWLVPWTGVVAGLLAYRVWQYTGSTRTPPIDDGDLVAADRSATDVVDDGPHPDHR